MTIMVVVVFFFQYLCLFISSLRVFQVFQQKRFISQVVSDYPWQKFKMQNIQNILSQQTNFEITFDFKSIDFKRKSNNPVSELQKLLETFHQESFLHQYCKSP